MPIVTPTPVKDSNAFLFIICALCIMLAVALLWGDAPQTQPLRVVFAIPLW